MSNAGKLAWGLVILLAILHFDFWNWDSTEVVLGFIPVGLAYQAGISIGAVIAWALVVTYAWPEGIEEWALEPGHDAESSGAATPGAGAGKEPRR